MQSIKKIFKKQITRKFFWTAILIVILFFLRILDMTLTLIALNIPNGFVEKNQLVLSLSPLIWVITNFCIIGFFSITNLILWILDKKKEKTIDIATIALDIMLLCSIAVNVWVVINNMLAFWIVLGN